MSSILLNFVKDYTSQQEKNGEFLIYKDFLRKLIHFNQIAKEVQREKINIQIFDKESKDVNNYLLNSKYVCDEAKKYIKKHYMYILRYTIPLKDRVLRIYFYASKYNENIKKQFDTKIQKIVTIYLFLSTLSSNSCGKLINIHIALTLLKKRMPKHEIDIMDVCHVNSAVTTSCALEGDVCIYREEEWCKVLIHELMHILGLDFSTYHIDDYTKQLRDTLNIKSEYLVYETYCEIWATLLHTLCFTYFELFNGKKFEDIDIHAFYRIHNTNLNIERTFTILQVAKILDHMQLEYQQLWSNNSDDILQRKMLYRENTNVLCYYILKQGLLLNSATFLEWCMLHNGKKIIPFNKNPKNIKFFVYELIQLCKHKNTLKYSKYGKEIMNSIIKMNNNTMLLDTCKMTILTI